MAFCSQCGKPVTPADRFCAHCGGAQPVEPQRHADLFGGLSPRVASILCYVPMLGWIGSIVVLASDRFRNNRALRFHAFQGLYLFVAWLIADHVLGPMLRMLPGPMYRADKLLELIVFGGWIFMIIKAAHEETYALPIIGDLAQKSASEQ
ncbi:MAG: hypothetical protein HYR60_29640 [Acidobacteria bacterium]|nr:hypothetical protein [Acidobacteriota bacterium]MBI3472215.1 hypothetical protein [Candidatus Solibacter usitatus]